jgi:hypothetical protein
MPKLLRYVILFGGPVFVGAFNLAHPIVSSSVGVYQSVSPHVEWWIILHVLNLAGFALLGLAAYVLFLEERGVAATISRVALVIFIPFYIGFDALIGLGTGTLVQYASHLPPDQLPEARLAIESVWASSLGMVLATIGSIAWGISMLSAAIALTDQSRRRVVTVLAVLAFGLVGWGVSTSSAGTPLWWIALTVAGLAVFSVGRPRLPATFLVLAGMLFGTTHVVPIGPLGMACFAVGAAWLEWAVRRTYVPVEQREVQGAVAERDFGRSAS